MVETRFGGYKLLQFLKNSLERYNQVEKWERVYDIYPSPYEQIIYADRLLQEKKPGRHVLDGLANCADMYLKERMQGTLKKEAEKYKSIEDHLRVRREEEDDYLLS